jgi:ATP-dependent DNA helicase RecG
LITDEVDEFARARLTAFVGTSDGFRLAEQDLQLRGPGELLGRQQHGWMRLRVADVLQDRELLDTARKEAVAMVEQDPALSAPALRALRRRLAPPVQK